MGVEFRLLGELAIDADGQPVAIRGRRLQTILAVLLVEANRAVSTEQLIDRVWGAEKLPERPANALQTQLTLLRRALRPVAGVGIRWQSSGYRLSVDEQSVDLQRFRDLLAAAYAAPDDERAAPLFERALGLWRGEPFATLDAPWLNAVRTTLVRERFAARLELADIRLRRGQHAALLASITELAGEWPLDERLAGQVMLVLHRCGRSADALQHYQRTRELLREELGIDPGSSLRQLHEQILRGQADRPASPTPPPVSTRSKGLPSDLPDFTGRDGEIARLAALDDTVPSAVVIEAIDGMAGIGKTALAVHIAHRLAPRFPDAQVFVDLHGHTPGQRPTEPMAALYTLLRAIGVAGEQIPPDPQARAARWRAELANRRAVVVLDNAASAAQIRPLLPGNAGCVTLITSRRRLADLDTAQVFSLDVLTSADGAALFGRIVGDDRAAAAPAAVDEVVRLCDGLPLAIRIAAARLRSRPAWSVAHLVERLKDRHRLLGELTVGDRSVAATFTLSYRYLSPAQQRLFRLLGLHPGDDFEVRAAAALSALDVAEAERFLEDLVDVHVLYQPTAGRYRFHDLLRAYAAQLAADTESEADRLAAVTRLFDHYRRAASAAVNVVSPENAGDGLDVGAERPVDRGAAITWLETEHATLMATAMQAERHGLGAHALALSSILWRYLELRAHHDDALALHATAVRLSAGDRVQLAEALIHLGRAYWWAGQLDLARDNCERALALARETRDPRVEGYALYSLGLAYWRLGRHEQAIAHVQQALALSRDTGDRTVEGYALLGLGLGQWLAESLEHALANLRQALAVARDIGDRAVEVYALHGLALIYWRLCRLPEALLNHRQALSLSRDIGDRAVEGYALYGLGLTYWRLGQSDEALSYLRQALTLVRETGDHTVEGHTHYALGLTHLRMGDRERAMADLGRALELARAAGDRIREAEAEHGIGRCQLAAGQLAEARAHFERALSLARETGRRTVECEVLNGLGEHARLTDDPAAALDRHSSAMAIAVEVGDRYEQAAAHRGLAWVHRRLGDLDEAWQHRKQALAEFTELGVPEAEELRGGGA
jgi:tetratricopeptide (TPR) repeat protein/DNA-binding SARP family transcriptional activator